MKNSQDNVMCFDEADLEQCTFSEQSESWFPMETWYFLLAYENILLSLGTIQEFIAAELNWRAAKLKLQQKLQIQGTKEIQF